VIVLDPSLYRRMAWKNGGGATTEIAIDPPEAKVSGGRFNWRISIADVTADGPFSLFPGYERRIMLLQGQGMVLDIEGQKPIELLRPFVPRGFSGDSKVNGKLSAGAVRDFNLITDHQTCRARLVSLFLDGRHRLKAPDGMLMGYVASGEVSSGGRTVGPGHTIRLDAEELDITGEGAVLAVASLRKI